MSVVAINTNQIKIIMDSYMTKYLDTNLFKLTMISLLNSNENNTFLDEK